MVVLGPESSVDIRIDYPDVFVVMPLSEAWSEEVYNDMLKPGIEAADLVPKLVDSIVRLGDLSTNMWQRITQAGVVVADVSVPNPNVYCEIGLADALGKPVFLFKQGGVELPADFSGSTATSPTSMTSTRARSHSPTSSPSGPTTRIISRPASGSSSTGPICPLHRSGFTAS